MCMPLPAGVALEESGRRTYFRERSWGGVCVSDFCSFGGIGGRGSGREGIMGEGVIPERKRWP